ncbi:MAG: porin [Bacteroidota bacterium]|nr:porin [Bacteroidota bacterium]
MKKTLILFFLVTGFVIYGKAQNTNDVLNLLIANKVITQEQADSVRAEAAIKQQESDANKKSFPLNTSRQIQLSGYTQIRYQNLEEKGKASGFDIRRARIDLKGTISPIWAIRFQTELAGSPKILDAYAECKLADYFNLTIGQAKVPFSLENLASSNKLELIDRSQVVEALSARGKDVIGNQNGRDIGIQVGGSFLKINDLPLFEYRFGVFNGAGINTSDANSAKDIAGRLVAHPIKGFAFGGSFYNGWDVFGKTTPIEQERSRYGLELSYDWNIFSVKSEYIHGKDGITKRDGWYAQAGAFIIPQKLQVLFKYDTYDPDKSKTADASTIYILGVNYNFNNWSRIQAVYNIKQEQGPKVNNNFGVIQYQISF